MEHVIEDHLIETELVTKKAKKKTATRRAKEDLKALKAHSKAKTPVEKIAKVMKRSGPTLRQKAASMGISLGHR